MEEFTYESSCTTRMKRFRVRKCWRVGKETRNGSGGEWRMKSIGNVEKLPSSVSFPLSFSATRFFLFLLANILSLSFPSFLPSPPPRLRTRNDHSSCRPISLNSRGVFTKGVSRKGRGGEEKGKEKKEEGERERETLESRSSTFTWRRHSGHNYVANRVNEFFPACRISRATRVKSRRRRILRFFGIYFGE